MHFKFKNKIQSEANGAELGEFNTPYAINFTVYPLGYTDSSLACAL